MRRKAKEMAMEIRKWIVRMHQIGPNVGSSMSAADIIAVLFFEVMNMAKPDDPERDRFILSKGHAVSALYAALALKGFFELKTLEKYMHNGGLPGHPVQGTVPGIEYSTGSLGHGLSVATGMALSDKTENHSRRYFVLMGDGECQEGSLWESAILPVRLGLGNVTAIVDANNLQGYSRVDNILPVERIEKIWRGFGWNVVTVDGHDVQALQNALGTVPKMNKVPTAVIARTVKGKGVREMEDRLGWHYYSVPSDRVEEFVEEIGENE